MSIRYRNRARRFERMLSRIENTRRTIAAHRDAAIEQQTWWRRHGGTLETWRTAIAEHHHRRPEDEPATAVDRFRRWTSRLPLHPRVLRLRLECWWLTLRLGLRDRRRGPRA